MKDFIKYLLRVSLYAFITYYVLIICYIAYVRSVDVSAPPDVRTVIFGNSVGETAVNDKIIGECKNYCHSGLNYDMEEGFIKTVFEKKPNIETVVLCFDHWQYNRYSNTTIRNCTPSRYTDSFKYIAFSNLNKIKTYSLHELIKMTIGSNVLINSWKIHWGYNRLIRYNLHQGIDSIEYMTQHYKTVQDKPYNEAVVSSSLNLNAFKHIVEYILQRHKTVIILSTPMYHLDHWFGRKGYEDFLRTLDQRVLIADYSDFPMPSDDCYGDVTHLNYKGAEYFSKHLKEHGLNAIPVKEYLEQRSSGIHNVRCSD